MMLFDNGWPNVGGRNLYLDTFFNTDSTRRSTKNSHSNNILGCAIIFDSFFWKYDFWMINEWKYPIMDLV